MKTFTKIVLLVTVMALGLAACNKVGDLPNYGEGTAPVLSASTTTINTAPADSNKVALKLKWTNPRHATAESNMKFTIQMDSAGKNFSRPFERVVMGPADSIEFIAKELNNMLLSRGYAFNIPVDIDVRVISSYANNNEQLASNSIRIKMTPYKVPPKIALPTSGKLFIVGSATQGDWSNPVPVPAQELHRIDETTWGGIFQLNGGAEFLLLPVNGDWGNKYSVANNTVPGLNQGGDFGFNLPDNFPGPAAAGLYKIIVDFQTGKFTVTPFTEQHGLPTELFIVGGATPGGWSNPVPVPSQRFTRVNSSVFELNIALTAGEKYLFLPENGNWGKKYGAVNGNATNIGMGGPMKPEGDDMPAPSVSGTYKITVNFLDMTYKLTQ